MESFRRGREGERVPGPALCNYLKYEEFGNKVSIYRETDFNPFVKNGKKITADSRDRTRGPAQKNPRPPEDGSSSRPTLVPEPLKDAAFPGSFISIQFHLPKLKSNLFVFFFPV